MSMNSTEARSRALSLLGRREHSRAELRRKLAMRGVGQETLEGVLDRLEHDGLLSESRFVEAFVHARTERGQGPVKIRAELARRGIEDDLIERYLTHTDDYWLARARAARTRRFGACVPTDEKAWASQARFLTARGFPADLVYAALTTDAD